MYVLLFLFISCFVSLFIFISLDLFFLWKSVFFTILNVKKKHERTKACCFLTYCNLHHGLKALKTEIQYYESQLGFPGMGVPQ